MRAALMIALAAGALGLSACNEHELEHASRLDAVTVAAIGPAGVEVVKGGYHGAPDTPLSAQARTALVERTATQRDGEMDLGAGHSRVPVNSAVSWAVKPLKTAISGREAHQNF